MDQAECDACHCEVFELFGIPDIGLVITKCANCGKEIRFLNIYISHFMQKGESPKTEPKRQVDVMELECGTCGAVYTWDPDAGDDDWAKCPHCGDEGPVEDDENF